MKNNCLFIIIFIFAMIVFFIWQNSSVVVSKYEYKNSKLSINFNGFKILHISDLHNKNFHESLYKKIKDINPDIIIITGDLIDRRRTRVDIAVDFVSQIVNVAPVYYVSGNHEQLSTSYDDLKEELVKLDVHILDNEYMVLNHNGERIGIMGLADPALMYTEGNNNNDRNRIYAENNLKRLYENSVTEFNILLSHRPELFEVYKNINIDLVFSGHAHGGQIRIPFIGGILSPNQGFFPKYSEGMITEDNTTLVVSRGLGNSIFPLRIFNRPELIVVEFNGEVIKH
ncbi:metallophosphoesterase [Sedimentibacter hydroxybenzoicus DSM 7310]|uniref:Metallophosphoesterase n=1 Tax=Sedimentibacter hydroxybenzoicus DSM 7310 TaxID=1123245 RepID=A0A974BHL5_SEDHY|nr:metallophosphoesterase [Sedimentibacter hydroxybenzoicus]NYB72977.1 metallophosphoesterase [Sedimentibacter hydroxybenzoicus DSM 7310]